MDDRDGESEPGGSAWFAELLSGGRHRWHAAPGDDSLFVLDDGTGDVELRLQSVRGLLHAALLRRDEEVERFDLSSGGRGREAFQAWLDEAVERHADTASGENSTGKTRFIVSFGAAQIGKLRAAADRENIPVAEIVRRAVDEYLAGRGTPPGDRGRPVE